MGTVQYLSIMVPNCDVLMSRLGGARGSVACSKNVEPGGALLVPVGLDPLVKFPTSGVGSDDGS